MASMIEKIQPMLDPGETVRSAMMGQTGLHPRFRFVTRWATMLNKPRIVAVTDKRIAVFKGGRTSFTRGTPKELLYSLDRTTKLEHGSGGWSKIALGNEKVWMSRKSYQYLDQANAEVGAV
ncbi:MAG: hypothetical protein NVS3B21_03350 [Acidimicrobiales bacterium]